MADPTLAEAKVYLEIDAADNSRDTEISSALASELNAQRRVCRRPMPRTVAATTANGSAVVTALPCSFTGRQIGAGVTGTGIPAGVTVVSVDSDAQLTLSAPATADGTVTLTITPDTADLDEALFRRVAHNLALRGLPLGVQASMTDTAIAQTRVGGTDAEVRRLEGPYRRIGVG